MTKSLLVPAPQLNLTRDLPPVRRLQTRNGPCPVGPRSLPSWVPPLHQTLPTRCWNTNQLSIAYAFRPRLRSRLTLRRLALLRNPWANGGGVSHSSFVTYACILTSPRSTVACRNRFTARGTLSYRSVKDEAHSFGGRLEPRYIIRARALDQ